MTWQRGSGSRTFPLVHLTTVVPPLRAVGALRLVLGRRFLLQSQTCPLQSASPAERPPSGRSVCVPHQSAQPNRLNSAQRRTFVLLKRNTMLPFSAASCASSTTSRPPHIALLVGDDFSWELWPRATNAPMRALLPRMASTFVDGGFDLQRHYSYPLCAPARSSLLTGRLPHRAYETADMRACKGISPGMSTLADKLKQGAGYATHFVG